MRTVPSPSSQVPSMGGGPNETRGGAMLRQSSTPVSTLGLWPLGHKWALGKIKSIHSDERGTAIVLIALAMTVIMGVTALVLDVGALYLEKAKISRAADAASLAGVRSLADDSGETDARAKAAAYAVANGLDLSKTSIGVDVGNNKVRVESSKSVPFGFAKLLGIQKGDVSAPGEAQTGALTGVMGAVPLSVVNQTFVYGQSYSLKEGAGDGISGNYQIISLGGTGSSSFEDKLKYGYDGMLRAGDIVPTEPGDKVSGTRNGLAYRLAATPSGWTFENATLDCPRLVIVPIIDNIGVNGRDTVQVVGFAAMYLDDFKVNGGHSYVTGRFKRMVIEGEMSLTQRDYGVKATKLIK